MFPIGYYCVPDAMVKNYFNKSWDGISALIFDATTTPALNSVMYHNTEHAASNVG